MYDRVGNKIQLAIGQVSGGSCGYCLDTQASELIFDPFCLCYFCFVSSDEPAGGGAEAGVGQLGQLNEHDAFDGKGAGLSDGAEKCHGHPS